MMHWHITLGGRVPGGGRWQPGGDGYGVLLAILVARGRRVVRAVRMVRVLLVLRALCAFAKCISVLR